MREVASNRMDSDYIILFLFVLVAPSATQQKTPATPATHTDTAGQVSTTSHEAELPSDSLETVSTTALAEQAETAVNFSTKATDPNPPKNVSWSPNFGPVLTFNFSVDGLPDCCEVTVEGETFQDKNATVPCNNVTLSGLRNGTTYNMTVTVRSGDKSSVPKTFTFSTKAAVPSEPGNFTAAETTSTSVTLTWSPPVPYPGHTNYTLNVTDLGSRYYETSTDGKKSTKNISIEGYDSWNYTVTGLRPAWNYSFSLFAETEEPGFSNSATTVRCTNDSAPGKVTNLNLTYGQVAYKQVVATWQCPDVINRNTRITGFAVKTTLVGMEGSCHDEKCGIIYVTSEDAVRGPCYCGTYLSKLANSSCKDQRIVINVTAETQYVVEVQTLGEKYNSTDWVRANISVPAGPPGPVEELNAIPNESSIKVMWKRPTETNGALLGYGVFVFTAAGGCVQAIWYQHHDEKKFGLNTGCKSNNQILGNINENCSSLNQTTDNSPKETSELNITNLNPDTKYQISAFAVNCATENYHERQRVVCNVTTAIAAPTTPENFTASAVTNTTVNLTWLPVRPCPGPTNYSLIITDLGSRYYDDTKRPAVARIVILEGCKTESYMVTELQPAWNYMFSLSAKTVKGSSENVKLNHSTDDSVPGTVQNLTFTAEDVSYRELKATWQCPDVIARNTLITGFIVQRMPSMKAFDNQRVVKYINVTDCHQTQTTTLPIQPENQYLIQVKTLGQQFNSSDWVNKTFCAPAETSQEVRNLSAVSLNSSAVVVRWDKPYETNGALCGYGLLVLIDGDKCVQRIWYKVSTTKEEIGCTNTVCNEWGHLEKEAEKCTNVTEINEDIKTSESKVTIDGLIPYTSYNITVVAVNRAPKNNGEGQRGTCSVTTNMTASDPVKNLNITSINETSLNVSWNQPAEIQGVLLGYGVTVLNDPNYCVQEIHLMLTDKDSKICNKMVPESQPKYFEGNCTQRTLKCVDTNNPDQEIMVTGLLPDTTYIITVFAVNGATQDNGAGRRASANETTKIAAPSNPTNFSAMSVTNTSVSLTWSPPVPRPGPTGYTLVINDLGSRYYSSSTQSPTIIHLQGYKNTSYRAEDLHPAWNYTFSLSAYTATGGSRNITLTISTNDSVPGVVQNLTLSPGDVPFKEVIATWRCPSVNVRNTRITGFAVRKRLNGQNSEQDVFIVDNTDVSCETAQSKTLRLTPENSFQIEVKALGEHFNGSTWVNASFNTSAGAPPNMNGTLLLHPLSELKSQTSFPVSLCTPCLFDESNGKIDYLAVIICATESCNQLETSDLHSEPGVRNLSSWHEAKNEDFQVIYRPTNETWQEYMRNITGSHSTEASRQKRSAEPYVYVVGEDNDCATQPATAYCNGPLPAGRSFRVAVVSCTTQACSRSELSEEFRTLDADNSFPDAAKAGVAVGIVFACAVIVSVLLCKRRCRAKKSYEEDESTEMTDLTGRPISMKEFLKKMEIWMSSNPSPLVQEFQEIKELSPKHSQETTKIGENGLKNRYKNILPFDHSRVQLRPIPGDASSDYINANFIPGYHSKHEYIATQGPLEHTTADFWRMVWEQNVPVIVMLSGFVDAGVKKVFPYFPDDEHLHQPQTFGTITVTLKRVCKMNAFELRTFTLAAGKVQRTVQHFLISDWVDHGANLDVEFLLQFVKRVRTEIPPGSKNPMVVHCSAGVGRTGTFIALDYLTQYMDNKPESAPIDIFSYVLSMRNCRTSMVQTEDQYVLLYLAAERLIQWKTNAVPYEEHVYANLGYEDDETDGQPDNAKEPGSDLGRKGAADGKPKTDVTPVTGGQRRPGQPKAKGRKIFSRVASTDSLASCSSGKDTSKLLATGQRKKITRPSEETSKEVLRHETPARGDPKQMATDANRLSAVLSSSPPVKKALASYPTQDGKGTAAPEVLLEEPESGSKDNRLLESVVLLAPVQEISIPASTHQG